jgi:Bacterial EndoU nuclease
MNLRLSCLVFCLFLLPFEHVWAKEAPQWSDTKPALNLTHIFKGEINRKGKPTGFHYESPNPTAFSARIKEILSKPNKYGVYTAIVEIFDPKTNQWKSKFSSLFPKALSKDAIITAIVNLVQHSTSQKSGRWRGQSEYGFPIEGYRLKDGRIITAYPIYEDID